jgi:hypothetical protein
MALLMDLTGQVGEVVHWSLKELGMFGKTAHLEL